MLYVGFDINVENAIRDLREFSNDVDRAVGPALNKVAGSARTQAVRLIAAETGLTQREVRTLVDIRRASRNYWIATIVAKPRAFNIIRFKAWETKQGVSAAPWRKRRVYRGTFIGNQGRTVFARELQGSGSGSSGRRKRVPRLPIKSIKGPSVRVEFTRKYVDLAIRKTVDERFPLEHESAFLNIPFAN